jgi:4-hydroxybenzoate polyprenyltransferase
MVYSYCAEYFYQVKKRNQTFPFAQLLGRIDFTLFPAAGYLVNGYPDVTIFLFCLFFYPFVMVHLGINDIIDIANDQAKELKTVTVLYGIKGTNRWILGFTIVHFMTAILFFSRLGLAALAGFAAGFILLSIVNYKLLKANNAQARLKVLPLFHITLLVYAGSIMLDSFLRGIV